ncbi:MAG: response regulator [Elusimicrobia bacterium]|nr:response regulator [Elusimicrobiota bacterium]
MHNGKKILIVDDDFDSIDTLQMILENSGYIVLIALNGASGIQMAHEHKPDIIILDVMMPDMNGYQVCEKLKSDADTQYIPVIMLTGRDKGEDVTTALDKQADWLVTKPYDVRYLMSKVASFLGAH